MKYGYRREFYEGVADTAAGGGVGDKGKKRSVAATAASVLLCAAASVFAGQVYGGGALAEDAIGQSPAMTEDASFVMSWVFDDETSADAERIESLAEEYMADHTPGGAD